MKIIKRCLFSVVACFVFTQVVAQAKVEKLTVQQALVQAREEGKVLMVVMDDETGQPSNDTVSRTLSNYSAFIINQQAVIIRPVTKSADWDSLLLTFYRGTKGEVKLPGVLYFDRRGKLIHRFNQISRQPNEYLNQAMLARRLADLPNENQLLTELNVYGYTNINLVSQLLALKNELGKPTEDLLASYIAFVPVDSFSSFSYFQLLARFCPVLHSKADSILRGSKNFDNNWSMLDDTERQAITYNVNNKTMEYAVTNKDYGLARFLVDSTINNGLRGAADAQIPMLRKGLISHFYWRVKDTVAYLRTAEDYADNYLMQLNVDSLHKRYKLYVDSIKKTGQPYVLRENGTAASYGSQLNYNAWQFYKMTTDPVLLQKALGWIKRAIQMNETLEANGAYALLLYSTGETKKGISIQKQLTRSLTLQNRINELSLAEVRLSAMKKGLKVIN